MSTAPPGPTARPMATALAALALAATSTLTVNDGPAQAAGCNGYDSPSTTG